MEEELTITVEVINHILIVRLQGDLTKEAGEQLLHFLPWEQGLPNEKNVLILNFEESKYINSSGIAYLIRLCRILHEQGVVIRGFGLEYHYEKMFQIVGLTKYLTHFPSEWAAIEGMAGN